MTPYEKAAAHYLEHFTDRPGMFTGLLDAIGKNPSGYIYSDSKIFVAATETRTDLDLSAITDPDHPIERGTGNVWFIHLFAGDFADVIAYSPYPRDYVAFSRLNRGVRFHPWNRLVDSLAKRGKLSERSRHQLANHQNYGLL